MAKSALSMAVLASGENRMFAHDHDMLSSIPLQLYFAPMSCSLVARVIAAEAGVPLRLQQVELFAATLTDSGAPLTEISELGLVPVLRLPDGSLLREVCAIAQYLAELAPERGLLAAVGSPARYRTLQWLSTAATELHKKLLWVIANPGTPPESKAHARGQAPALLAHLERHLAERSFVADERFTIADAYLGWGLLLARHFALELPDGGALRGYLARVTERPAFRDALAAELPLALAAQQRRRAP
jgi:glutathione S-transferase